MPYKNLKGIQTISIMARILIIGGGVAGLSAGIYAQLHGHKTIICEQHYKTGGNLTGWQRGEYHIDNCIHWLTGTNPNSDLYKLWQEVGALDNIDVYQCESMYTCEKNGDTLSLFRDIDKLEKRMLEISPEDKKEIKRFINAVKDFELIMGVGGKNHDKKANAATYLKIFPTLYSYYNMTTKELANRFSHPLLREFFVSLLGYDFGAIAFLCVASTFCSDNGGLPKGGSQAMAQRMTNKFLSLGGEILLKKQAIKIDVENGKATQTIFGDGSKIRADYIILTTEPSVTFEKILPVKMPKELKSDYESKKLTRFSAIQTAFACDLPSLPFSADHIFELPIKYRKILKTERLIIREFSHEPSFAPSGQTVIQSLTFCLENTAKDFIELRKKDKNAYDNKKQEIASAVLLAITEKFPSLCGHLKLLDVWTPASYNRYTGAQIGAFMSFAFSSKVLPIRKSNRIKGLNNVIMASQWLQNPGGLPLALQNGKHAVETVNKLASLAPTPQKKTLTKPIKT